MINWKNGVLGSMVLVLVTMGVFSAAGYGAASGGAGFSSIPAVPPLAPNQLNLTISLKGQGATFPQPLIANWTKMYHASHNNVTITYAGVGSGGGQSAFINKTVDFAASDAPLSTAQRIVTPNVLHIPETIGSVTASYNIPQFRKIGLNFTGLILANIYSGIITKWNDPAIVNINPGTTLPNGTNVLPNQLITPVFRSESSGTTFVWSSFLCLDSTPFCSTYGPPATTINWPVGVGAKGNGGVAGFVNNTAYTLGYVELNYALTHGLTYGKVQNAAPNFNFILPSLRTTAFAVSNSTQSLPSGQGDWSSVSLLNAPGANTYPIASFTYFLVYKELNVVPSMDLADKVQFNALINFLNWVITTGQTFSSGNAYVPLPPAVVAIDQASINSITYSEVSVPVARTFNLSADSTFGWNGTRPGPAITVVSGDQVTINFRSNDTLTHIWYIDFDNNRVQDLNETNIQSTFSTSTSTPYTFTPTIWNQTSVPKAGTFVYRDANNANMNGTIIVLPQQVAAAFLAPNALKTTATVNPAHVDTSNVVAIGSLVIDMRTLTASGNITIAGADHSSGAPLSATHFRLLSGLQLRAVSGTPGLSQLRFLMDIAVTPYSLSTDLLVQLQGTTATVTSFLTRELDFQTQGVVNINDLTAMLAAYGTSTGGTGFNPLADINADGTINILDVGPVLANFNAQVVR